jgi:Fe-S oxidoreductase
VREAEGRVIVAPGTSCREQILDGTACRALHPAEYLAARLNGD